VYRYAIIVFNRNRQANPRRAMYTAKRKKEERQGRAMVDAAIVISVRLFVYDSVDRGGSKSATNPTIVPHWATKHRIEKYLEEKSAGTSMQ
jgi:hypothetical protein